MSDKTAIEVIVHKAIQLAQGESLGDYTNQLAEDGRTYITKTLGLSKNDGCYIAEVYEAACIWSVYCNTVGGNGCNPGYYAVSYTRDANSGEFIFGAVTEVERTTVYEPVEPLSGTTKGKWVDKSKAKPKKMLNEDEAAKACGGSGKEKDKMNMSKACAGQSGKEKDKTQMMSKASEIHVAKNFWNGVLGE
jgi:hypothetical protein